MPPPPDLIGVRRTGPTSSYLAAAYSCGQKESNQLMFRNNEKMRLPILLILNGFLSLLCWHGFWNRNHMKGVAMYYDGILDFALIILLIIIMLIALFLGDKRPARR